MTYTLTIPSIDDIPTAFADHLQNMADIELAYVERTTGKCNKEKQHARGIALQLAAQHFRHFKIIVAP